ncbi:MAG: T4 RnlA family RNA ligase [Acidimicrobiales bacterium]
MTTTRDLFGAGELLDEIEAGYVVVRRHPSLALSILTYSREAQYDSHWNAVTTTCRGLVVEDETDRIIARPLPKFFNYAEHGQMSYAAPLPAEPFRIYDKVDGSLGIVFSYDGEWQVASKGSFVSDQARWAQRWIDGRILARDRLEAGLTYCCEIVYPENRIVVDYGSREDLVLLAAFHGDGREVPLEDVASHWDGIGTVVRSWDSGQDLGEIAAMLGSNTGLDGQDHGGTDAEGYVVAFASGIRVKAKFADYLRLHRLLTGVTERDVWRAVAFDDLASFRPVLSGEQVARALRCSISEVNEMSALAGQGEAAGGAIAAMIKGVPDEFDAYVRGVVARLTDEFALASLEAGRLGESFRGDDRGETARALTAATSDKTLRAAVFALLDGKDPSPIIWRSLYPSASKSFKEDDDT